MMSIQERAGYYQDENVRARILEFLGGDSKTKPSCCHLTGADDNLNCRPLPCRKSELPLLLEQGLEICRSLWDETSLLTDCDLEYVNFDHPSKAFLEPQRAFELQEPVAEIIASTLRQYGIAPLHLLSGRGHHFIWRIRQDSKEFQRLARLGRGPKSLWKMEGKSHPPDGKQVREELARAFAGLGLVMEFLAYRIKELAAPECQIPVELTAVEVGPTEHGREMISLDISEYGDPLYARTTRVPFSFYLKPWQQSWAFARDELCDLQPLFVAPLCNMTWREGLRIKRNPAVMTVLAEISSAKIPDASIAMAALIDDYAKSKVASFHDWFYAQEQHEPELWAETYDRLPVQTLPACARIVLDNPNDLLLRPAHIRRLVRIMLAVGWHPRHIAGLIYSKYASPFGWTQFEDCDPATRADFYTRIFAGSFVTGVDDLIDFNCVSAQEQKTCSFSNCGFNLVDFKRSALNRRAHAKLAHRPFNRLLLQPEHS